MNQENPTSYTSTPPTGVPGGQVFRPYVTYTLIGICVVIFLLQYATSTFYGVDIPDALGIKSNSLIIQGQVWRLFTPMFLHSINNYLHIVFNMYSLYYLGTSLERFYQHGRFLLLFLLSGFAGNVLSFIFSPQLSHGSSTAIFGLLGAEAVLLYQNREVFGNVARRALPQVVMIAAINLMIGLSPGIDNWGHVGGLLGGILFAWFGGPLFQRQGLLPPYAVKDVRGEREVITAAIGVAGLFAFLAIATTLLRL